MVKPIKRLTIYVGYGEDNPFKRDLANGIFLSSKSEQSAWLNMFNGDARFAQVTMTKNRMIYAHAIYDITEAFKVSFEVMSVRTLYQNPNINLADPSKPPEKIPANHGDVLSTDFAFWFFF
jgi:hypothetical protein